MLRLTSLSLALLATTFAHAVTPDPSDPQLKCRLRVNPSGKPFQGRSVTGADRMNEFDDLFAGVDAKDLSLDGYSCEATMRPSNMTTQGDLRVVLRKTDGSDFSIGYTVIKAGDIAQTPNLYVKLGIATCDCALHPGAWSPPPGSYALRASKVACSDADGATFELKRNEDLSTYELSYHGVQRIGLEGWYDLQPIVLEKYLNCYRNSKTADNQLFCLATGTDSVRTPTGDRSIEHRRVFRLSSEWTEMLSFDGKSRSNLSVTASYAVQIPAGETLKPVTVEGIALRTGERESLELLPSPIALAISDAGRRLDGKRFDAGCVITAE